MLRLLTSIILPCALALSLAAPSRAAEPDRIALGGGNTLTVFAAQAKGFYAQQNLDVTITKTSSSDELRDGVATGKIQLAAFSVDNAFAMADKKVADIVVLMGGENPPIQFLGNKGITAPDQLRGKTILVDSPVTQNAVIMKGILAKYGLEPERDYKMKISGGQPLRLVELKGNPTLGGTMVSWPELFQMTADGYPTFGSSIDTIGPMTFQVVFAKRDWVAAHKDIVERFLTAELKAQRYIMDPNNKDDVIAMLIKSRNYTPEVAATVYDAFMGPSGWAKDGAIDMNATARVMKLRAEVENGWGGNPPPPETYVDLSYLNEVKAKLDGK